MRYFGMPLDMWLLYRKSFRDNLIHVLNLNVVEADRTMKQAKQEYKCIIGTLPEFEKGDTFKMIAALRSGYHFERRLATTN